jgi:hypothetical protein
MRYFILIIVLVLIPSSVVRVFSFSKPGATDAEIGRLSGVEQRTVRTIRTRLGIDAWVPPKAESPAPKPPRVRAPRPKREPVAKVAPPPKAPPVPKPAPAPRRPNLREQLREQEPEPLPRSRVRLPVLCFLMTRSQQS